MQVEVLGMKLLQHQFSHSLAKPWVRIYMSCSVPSCALFVLAIHTLYACCTILLHPMLFCSTVCFFRTLAAQTGPLTSVVGVRPRSTMSPSLSHSWHCIHQICSRRHESRSNRNLPHTIVSLIFEERRHIQECNLPSSRDSIVKANVVMHTDL